MKEAPTLQPGLPELVHFQLTEAAFTDSSWKSALRAAMRVLEEPRYLKAERLAAVRRGIEETVEKFGDQHPRQKDKMIAWGKLQIQLIEDFVAESKLAELRVGTTRLSPLVGKATGNVASEDDLRLEVENVSLRRLLAQAGIHAAEQKVAERLQRVQHRHPATAVRCALRVTLIRD